MKMSFGLNLQQTQKLIMTPELRQSIMVLQLNALELSQYIRQEVLENPLLELKEPVDEGLSTESGQESEQFDWEKFDWEAHFNKTSLPVREAYEAPQIESFTTKTPTLEEALLSQLRLVCTTDEEYQIGRFLIGNIDDNGYLRCDVAEVSERLHVPVEQVEEVIQIIQTLEPVGVGARDLKECLLIQLDYLGIEDPVVRRVVESHLKQLAEGKYQKIAAALGVSVQEVQKAADLIRTLDPKPGRRFAGSDEMIYVIPDVIVEKVDGDYVVLVNDSYLPRLGISAFYKGMLQRSTDEATRTFLKNRLDSALWLLRSIEQRRLTMYKVAQCIVDMQREFLEFGVKHLKPMTLKQVAQYVNVHESTVSRAINNKYMQTPRGTFSMKFFFGSGVEGSGGDSVSAKAVMRIIQDAIKGEDCSKPYTDKQLQELLLRRGLQISRRTVTKYREELGIQSSSRRRRY
ncbi:MAG TPA: RNA polymerase factor sigma-54 [Firmicutes bacterium]|nr:RNA polymerase factor sigma-54 [Bacillota bacterium]